MTLPDPTPAPESAAERFTEWVVLRAVQMLKRPDSPYGWVGSPEFGQSPVRFRDPDLDRYLIGLRWGLVSDGWQPPTPEYVASRGLNMTGTLPADLVAALTSCVDAATDELRTRLEGVGVG